MPAGDATKYFDALRETIYERLLFVVIELQPRDNPQGIFESFNAQRELSLPMPRKPSRGAWPRSTGWGTSRSSRRA